MIRLPRRATDFKKYFGLHTRFVYLDMIKVAQHLGHDRALLVSMEEEMARLMDIGSNGSFKFPDKKNVIAYLRIYHNVSPEKLLSKAKRKNKDGPVDTSDSNLSLEAEVLTALINEGCAVEFLTLFMEHSSLRSTVGILQGIKDKLVPTDLYNNFGHRLGKCSYDIGRAKTNRLQTRNPNFQGLSRNYLDIISSPNTHVLLTMDMKQIEALTNYYAVCYDPELNESFIRSEDIYRFMWNVMVPNEDEIYTTDFRAIHKRQHLAVAYNQHLEATSIAFQSDYYANKIHAWYDTNVRRKRYKELIKARYNAAKPIIVQDFFGNRMTLAPDGDDMKQGLNALYGKLFNYPNQMASMGIVAGQILSILDKTGTGEDTVQLVLSRHDEGILMINRAYLEQAFDIIMDHTLILVGNWKPIRADIYVWSNYTEEMLSAFVPGEQPTEEVYKELESTPEPDYFPLRDEIEVSAGHKYIVSDTGSKLLVAYVELNDGTTYYDVSGSETVYEMFNRLLKEVVCMPKYHYSDFVCIGDLPYPALFCEAVLKIKEEDRHQPNFYFNPVSNVPLNEGIINTVLHRLGQQRDKYKVLAEYFNAKDLGHSLRRLKKEVVITNDE